MTCIHCGTHKVGECNCLETLIVSVDDGGRLEFVKMTYVEMDKLNRMEELEEFEGEVECYPLEAVPFRTAEEVREMLS